MFRMSLQNLFKRHSNGYQTVLSDKEIIKSCMAEVIHKTGFSDSSILRQRDFDFLSDEIEKSTGVLISVSTLKRILNGQFNQLPQAATLNAIAAYLGYQSWPELRKDRQPQLKTTVSTFPRLRNKRRISYRIFVPITGVVLLLLILALSRRSVLDPLSESNVLFSVKKTTKNDIPNTVVFKYDIGNVRGDSFFIQQSWDRDRRVKIEKNKTTLTDIYYEPGYHTAKLMVNDQVIKTLDVSIPTDGWFFFSKPGLFKGLPTHIIPKAAVRNGVLSLTREDIVETKVDPGLENFYYYTLFPEKYKAGSDNFILKARIRFKAVNNTACPTIVYEVYGQRNSLYFFTTMPGCTSNIGVNVGEHHINGKTADLSDFGVDIAQWQDIEVRVQNKQATFYIGSRKVFSKSYTMSPGLITGLAFMANGLCELDQVSLKGLDGTVVYEDNFNETSLKR